MSTDLTLTIGSTGWRNWTSWQMDTDFLTAADAWSVEAANPTPEQVASLSEGQPISLLLGDQLVLRGTLDSIQLHRDRSGTRVSLSGRDLAGALADCSPVTSWSYGRLSVAAVAAKALSDCGLSHVSVQAEAEANETMAVKLEAGEPYWALIERLSKRVGLMAWMEPTGVLRLGRPDYSSPVVGGLRHAISAGGNVLVADYSRELHGRFSTLRCLGQLKGGESWSGDGPQSVRATSTDDDLVGAGVVRPGTVDVGELVNSKQARARAAWEVGRRQFDATQLRYTVRGLGPRSGELWTPNTQVAVEDEVFGPRGTWWIRGVHRSATRESGVLTILHLRQPNLLLPEV